MHREENWRICMWILVVKGLKQAIEAHTATAYLGLSTVNWQELLPAQLPQPLPGWDTSPPQHCSQWYVASKKKKNYRPVRGEVKWEIVSWLRSKWLWATKLGKNYVVSKIYIRFLISWLMLPLCQIFRIYSSKNYYSIFSLPFVFAYIYVIPLTKWLQENT